MFQKLTSNRIKFLILSFLFVVLLPVLNVKAVVKPTSNFYVNDYANILSDETEKFIMDHSVSLAEATTAQIVVVTVPNLEGEAIESYATKLFREFGIGDKQKNNGLLILLAVEERLCRIEVGYGLEGLLPDGKTGRFQDDYMIPYFKSNNFDEGMLNGYKAFFQEIAHEYGYSDESVVPVQIASGDNSSSTEDTIGPIAMGYFFVKLIIIGYVLTIGNKKSLAFFVLEGISVVIAVILYNFFGTTVALIYLVADTIANLLVFSDNIESTGGGRSSRGYYSGHSSGGSSFGGFHGGGGSSGGGGSTRGF